ncbi:hypothetical protein PFISCL1PPCAC_1332, partial [Pristionchus fissidentatus]
ISESVTVSSFQLETGHFLLQNLRRWIRGQVDKDVVFLRSKSKLDIVHELAAVLKQHTNSQQPCKKRRVENKGDGVEKRETDMKCSDFDCLLLTPHEKRNLIKENGGVTHFS